jgi:uncharacterized protein (DUF1501 family)
MIRRDLLKKLAYASAMTACASQAGFSAGRSAPAGEPSRWLVHLYLSGGPDLRHLIVPEFNSDVQSYGYQFWQHRATAWGVSSVQAMAPIWAQMHWVEENGVRFGFHPKATWLVDQWKQGNVAIVNNVVGSTSRNHELATRVMEVGDVDTKENDRQRSGWGGRLADAMGENILSLTPRVRQFCYGPSVHNVNSHDNARVISARNMRQFGLYSPDSLIDRPDHTGSREVMSRALSQYYQAKGQEVPDSSPYRVFFQHHKTLSEQGALIRERLNAFEHDAQLKGLMEGDKVLNNRSFAQQCLNLVDATVCKDLLNSSIASLEYGGWDSHRDQRDKLDQRFSDIFSNDGGLAQTHRVMAEVAPEVKAQSTWMISGEFGRQLRANGDGGTDHGRGNSVLLIGQQVKGGLYGDLFPSAELDVFDQPGKDILGQTEIEPLLGKLCDWLKPSSASSVIPQSTTRKIESGNSLDVV